MEFRMSINEKKHIVFMSHSPQLQYYDIISKVLKKEFGIYSSAWVIGKADFNIASKMSFDNVLNLNDGINDLDINECNVLLRSLESKHHALNINLNISFDRHYKRNKWNKDLIIIHLATIAKNVLETINSDNKPYLIIGEANTAPYRLINQITGSIIKVCPMVVGHLKDRFYFETDVLNFSWPDLKTGQKSYLDDTIDKKFNEIINEKQGTQTQKTHNKNGTFALKSKLSYKTMAKRIKTDFINILKKRDCWDHKAIKVSHANILTSSLRYCKQLYISKYIKKYMTNSLQNIGPTGVYFLHFQPEITVDGLAYKYSDQATAIRLISNSLPISETLIVKEHPLMIGKRNISFYKDISRLHNVIFVDLNFNSFDLIIRSKYVISLTGSAGLEGVFLGRPVFLLGDIFHDQLNGVFKVKSIKDLPLLTKNFLNYETNNFSNNGKEALKKIWNASYPGKIGHQYSINEMDNVENHKFIAKAFYQRFFKDETS
jgi:hypothetical protein